MLFCFAYQFRYLTCLAHVSIYIRQRKLSCVLIRSNNIILCLQADPKWEFPRNQLIIEQTLGEGEFGRVLRARAKDIAGQSGRFTSML